MMNLYHGDCLEVLPTFPPASVDAIITDLPYGTTACEWDSIIPLAPMWEQVKRVLKVNGAFITTASQPFTSALIFSNLDWFKYCMVYDKGFGSDFQLASIRPLKAHEDIVVFGKGKITYNPQMITRDRPVDARKWNFSKVKNSEHDRFNSDESKLKKIYTEKYPDSVLYFSSQGKENNNTTKVHPTQKPVALYEYLVRTYTNAGETVLDICMGSGTTGVAAIQTGREFIGIEKEQKYFEIASRRIAQAPQPLFTEPPRQPTQREPDKGNVTLNFEGFE